LGTLARAFLSSRISNTLAVSDSSHPAPSWGEPRELQNLRQGFREAEGSAPLHRRAIQDSLQDCLDIGCPE